MLLACRKRLQLDDLWEFCPQICGRWPLRLWVTQKIERRFQPKDIAVSSPAVASPSGR